MLDGTGARIGVGVLVLALVAALFVLVGGGDSGDESAPDDPLAGLSPVTDYVFQPTDAPGPDPFSPSFADFVVNVATDDLSTGVMAAGSRGLYGGSGENVCDVEGMIAFLTANPDRGQAWAAVQGITFEELPDYLRSLTPAILMENTLVMNHGYSDGEATPFLAVLEAGTAVLVDEFGIPRARCACGNPLTPPEIPPTTEETTTTTTLWHSRWDALPHPARKRTGRRTQPTQHQTFSNKKICSN